MRSATDLQHQGQDLAAAHTALLAQAQQLAATVRPGEHGRRRPGTGSTFWQYRPSQPHDEARRIDWRRSARSDQTFVRETEWQVAQNIYLWADPAASMSFQSDAALPSKASRARVLAMALAILLIEGGERVGLAQGLVPAIGGRAHLDRLAMALLADTQDEFGSPPTTGLHPNSYAVLLSDCLGPVEPLQQAVTQAADLGVRGALVMVLDPHEITFPFKGRTLFQSPHGLLEHDTQRADDLRAPYHARLAARQELLQNLADQTGWAFEVHNTETPAQTALLWLVQTIAGPRGLA